MDSDSDDEDGLDDTQDLLDDQLPRAKAGHQAGTLNRHHSSDSASLHSEENFEITASEQATAERPTRDHQNASHLPSTRENRNSLPADKFQQFMMNGAFPATVQAPVLVQGGADIVPGAPAGALFFGQNNNYFRSIENVNETTMTSNLAEEFLNTADDDFGRGKDPYKHAQKKEERAAPMGQREYFNDTQHSNTRMNPFLS